MFKINKIYFLVAILSLSSTLILYQNSTTSLPPVIVENLAPQSVSKFNTYNAYLLAATQNLSSIYLAAGQGDKIGTREFSNRVLTTLQNDPNARSAFNDFVNALKVEGPNLGIQLSSQQLGLNNFRVTYEVIPSSSTGNYQNLVIQNIAQVNLVKGQSGHFSNVFHFADLTALGEFASGSGNLSTLGQLLFKPGTDWNNILTSGGIRTVVASYHEGEHTATYRDALSRVVDPEYFRIFNNEVPLSGSYADQFYGNELSAHRDSYTRMLGAQLALAASDSTSINQLIGFGDRLYNMGMSTMNLYQRLDNYYNDPTNPLNVTSLKSQSLDNWMSDRTAPDSLKSLIVDSVPNSYDLGSFERSRVISIATWNYTDLSGRPQTAQAIIPTGIDGARGNYDIQTDVRSAFTKKLIPVGLANGADAMRLAVSGVEALQSFNLITSLDADNYLLDLSSKAQNYKIDVVTSGPRLGAPIIESILVTGDIFETLRINQPIYDVMNGILPPSSVVGATSLTSPLDVAVSNANSAGSALNNGSVNSNLASLLGETHPTQSPSSIMSRISSIPLSTVMNTAGNVTTAVEATTAIFTAVANIQSELQRPGLTVEQMDALVTKEARKLNSGLIQVATVTTAFMGTHLVFTYLGWGVAAAGLKAIGLVAIPVGAGYLAYRFYTDPVFRTGVQNAFNDPMGALRAASRLILAEVDEFQSAALGSPGLPLSMRASMTLSLFMSRFIRQTREAFNNPNNRSLNDVSSEVASRNSSNQVGTPVVSSDARNNGNVYTPPAAPLPQRSQTFKPFFDNPSFPQRSPSTEQVIPMPPLPGGASGPITVVDSTNSSLGHSVNPLAENGSTWSLGGNGQMVASNPINSTVQQQGEINYRTVSVAGLWVGSTQHENYPFRWFPASGMTPQMKAHYEKLQKANGVIVAWDNSTTSPTSPPPPREAFNTAVSFGVTISNGVLVPNSNSLSTTTLNDLTQPGSGTGTPAGVLPPPIFGIAE